MDRVLGSLFVLSPGCAHALQLGWWQHRRLPTLRPLEVLQVLLQGARGGQRGEFGRGMGHLPTARADL